MYRQATQSLEVYLHLSVQSQHENYHLVELK